MSDMLQLVAAVVSSRPKFSHDKTDAYRTCGTLSMKFEKIQ